MISTKLNPKVRQVLELLDAHYQQDDLPPYQDLEEALCEAGRSGNRLVEADLSWQMGTRLLSLSKVSRINAEKGQDTGMMPNEADALEPAINLFSHSLDMALSIQDKKHEKLARNLLAACYVQSRQFEKALEHSTRLFDMCSMPEDARLCFDASQKAGDCYLELENDEAALTWYQRCISIARRIDDPFEISVQLGKIATALSNLKRYDEALQHYAEARNLLVRIGNDEVLQHKISVHRNLFSVSALPNLSAYNDERMSHTREALGRNLLRELPEKLAASTLAILTNRALPNAFDWVVFRELDTAVRSAAGVLRGLLKNSGDVREPEASVLDQASALSIVGSLACDYSGGDVRDPEDLVIAARYLMQIDRSRRAALHVREAEASAAGPGPFGGAKSHHVVYLRSFVASPHLPHFEIGPWGQVDLEELFACLLDRSPLIALGNLDIERFGPGRARTSDENWRDVLRALAMEAQMLLVVPAPTEGTSWEIEWVVTNKFLHKTCFVMPPPGAGEEAWWAENWGKLKDWSVRLGVNLPEYTPIGCVFRLTSEGLIDRMDFSEVYQSDNLHLTLLTKLLFSSNISYDFLYGLQQGLKQEQESSRRDSQEPSTEEPVKAIGTDDIPADDLATLLKLEAETRFEFSNWHYDKSQIPDAPGVLLIYETPFRLLWAEEVSNLRDALARHAQGEASDFTRAFFWLSIQRILNTQEVAQLLEGRLKIESVMSFRIKQMVSYRFTILQSPEARTRLVDQIWKGASRHGAPQLHRPE